MSDFRQLQLPAPGNRGWYICTITMNGNQKWLSHTGTLTSDTSILDILYYDTELEAHEAAAAFYKRYTRDYAYADELMALRNKQAAVVPKINGSQVMEFV